VPQNQADSSKHYFRGVQTTDDVGRLDFDTCFPGCYMGRCIHICGSNVPMYTAQAEGMCDGVMLASKLLIVNV